LKFFLAARQSNEDCIRLVEQYQEQQRSLYELYRESEILYRAALDSNELPQELISLLDWPGDASDPEARRQLEIFFLTLRHGVLHVEGRLAWCEEALAHLHNIQSNED
jgi:hypothetical protein